jgi:cytochrome d ubiquinol oxidase subunit I
VVGATQPLKLAAMEAVYRTGSHVPLTLGGYYDQATHKMIAGIPVPDGLSLLEGFNADTKIQGLDSTTAANTPQVAVIHLAFDSMVGCGSLIFLIAGLAGWTWWRRYRKGLTPRIPHTKPWLWAAIATGPASAIAMLGGWEVTEGGRQPWIVYNQMLVTTAATKTGGLGWSVLATILIYLGLAAALLLILRRLATGAPSAAAPAVPRPPDSPDGPAADDQHTEEAEGALA